MLAKFFVNRPKFAFVISIVITLAGFLAMQAISVEQYPNISPPSVRVSTSYAGANAEVLEQTVAAPIEQAMNGVDDMIYMSSNNTNDGSYSLSVYFDIGTDPDQATINVQNRVQEAMPSLPEEVKNSGVQVRKQSPNMLMVINMVSPNETYDEVFLTNYMAINVQDALARVNGVGSADLITPFNYSMRIWLDPDRLTNLGLTATDVIATLREQNLQVSAGQIGAPPFTGTQDFVYTLKAKGRLETAEEFENIIIRADQSGARVLLKDVARVELGSQTYAVQANMDGAPVSVMALYQAPGANAVLTADRIYAEMDKIAERFPDDLEYKIMYDSTKFVTASMEEVIKTLIEAFVLVVGVVFLFLYSWRAALIPMIAIPVSLIGTFAILLALGYSANTVSMFALILAIGLVVDDAIIVVENVQRILDEEPDLNRLQATVKAMEQITGPVVAMTLVLLAVFIPCAFLPGITGELFRQFAVTISVSVFLSMINALTLSPALASILLKRGDTHPSGIFGVFDRGFNKLRDGYVNIVSKTAGQKILTILTFGVIVAAALYITKNSETGFVPDEDQGAFMVDIQLPDGASTQRTQKVMDQLKAIVDEMDGIDNVNYISGYSILGGGASGNAGLAIIVLDDWEERQDPALHVEAMIQDFSRRVEAIPGARISAFNIPPVPGVGSAAGVEFVVQQIGGGTPAELQQTLNGFLYGLNQEDSIFAAFSTYRADQPQYFIDLDRQKAKSLGIPLSDIFGTLQANLGGAYVNDFNLFGRTYRVMVQAESEARNEISDISKLYARAADGAMVPLSSLVTIEPILGPQNITRFNLFRSANVTVIPTVSTGQAMLEIEQLAKENLPDGYAIEFSGLSYQEKISSGQAPFILALAIIFGYLFLVAQYESWTIPISVLLSVSMALLGALTFVFFKGLDINIYTQIGIVMLVGLAAKNAILIVEFAKEEREAGKSIFEAAVEGARLRYRAVMMTAISFLLGVLPLMIASGAGAASRQSIGTAVFGGMAFATTLGVILIPMLYVLIQTMREKFSSSSEKLEIEKS